MVRRKKLTKRWYTMPIGGNGKRHRVWHEYNDEQWAYIQMINEMILYGDFNTVPDKIVGLSSVTC